MYGNNELGWSTVVDGAGAEEACLASRVGQRIDRFRLDELLGVGGMAAVYRAFDVERREEVALKVLRRIGAVRRDRFGRARFLREARILERLQDPRIVQIHEVGGNGDELWIALELLEGLSLSRALAEGRLTTLELVEILEQVLQALIVVHQAKVVHRDVTPNNIFLVAQPCGDYRVKLLDFGIAKFVQANGVERFTGVGGVIGTPHYMAPEQAAGDAVDHRADLWAVGALLYEGLAGQPLFDGTSPTDVIARIITQQPMSLGVVRPDLSPEVEAFVARALCRNVIGRWSTTRRMLGGLREMREAMRRGEHLHVPLPHDAGQAAFTRSPSRERRPLRPTAPSWLMCADRTEDASRAVCG